MNSKHWVALSVISGIAVVAMLAMRGKEPLAVDTLVTAASSPGPQVVAAVPISAAQVPANMGLLPVRPLGKQPSALDAIVPPKFKADGRGKLLIDPNARNEVELLVALYQREEGMTKLLDAIKGMPVQAQRDVRELYDQYVQYTQAANQAIPVDQKDITTLDQARSQFAAADGRPHRAE